MYRKIITYTDFDGNPRTETFRFNLTKAELTKMFNEVSGGLDKKLQDMIDKKDIPKIMANFEDLLDRSYGEMSADGRRFIKSPEILQAFKDTQAYSDFYMSLITDDEEAAAFIQGIIPAELRDQAVEQGVIEPITPQLTAVK